MVGKLVVPVVAFAVLWLSFDFLRDADANRFLVVGVALVVGVGGVFALYWGMDRMTNCCPSTTARACGPTCTSGRRWSSSPYS